MTHTDSCDHAQQVYKEHAAEYNAAHPNHCTHCKGWGMFFSTYDPSPAGVSLGSGSMLDVDTCPECVDKELCPLCKKPTAPVFGHEGNYHVCTECEWSAEDEKHIGMGDEPECFCQELSLNELTII